MKEYTIRYEEKSIMYYPIQAESEREALEEFDRLGRSGEIDFSNMEVIGTSAAVIEEKEVYGNDDISKADPPVEEMAGVEGSGVEVHVGQKDSDSVWD